MKYYIMFIYCSLILLFSCSTKDTKIPKEIMAIDSMKTIVWDMIHAGAYATYLKESDTTKKTSFNTAYMAAVLKLHKISKQDFFKNFSYYQQHPALNKLLFDSINAYAERQRNNMYRKYE